MKCSVFIATSLDGFIARENGDIDWLPNPETGEEDHGFQEFFDSVDYLVLGRASFEKALTFGGWAYGPKRVVIWSSTLRELPEQVPGETVEIMSGSAPEIVQRLEQRGARHLYIDGGRTIQGFLRAGLIGEMIITRVPVLIGSGIPLFGPLERDIRLRHVATRSYQTGLVQSRYEVEV